ncbi:lantibiotic dehydratase [Streptomyces kaniharaensis]|uniref:Lantibiotic dehydratase n=1 Tax=Streptomyces kaniharaensis TaxID=212423 RepID=A0A6N7KJ45_9ACTN|nr:lantibiotic dehydratase [Streptomyces kaniharaensis]MQS10735.1 lantibiotic dehydratase [Streptomyces kaniharaensis]
MTRSEESHLVPLGTTGWAVWRDVVLRSTGFPADTVRPLADPALAAAADAVEDTAVDAVEAVDAYRAEYARAAERLSAAVREAARTPRFREAVAWQNPKLLRLCLDKLAAGEPRNVRGRNHELTVAGYLQRYGLKNDTIGFVGPVGWARWTGDGAPVATEVGPGFLARRTVYFEIWAIDAVARALSDDPRVRPWLAPRLFAAHRLAGSALLLPGRDPVPLTPAESELLALVNGVRSVRAIADELAWSEFPELGDPTAVLAAVESLVERQLLRLDLVGTIEAHPERTLIARLELIPDPEVRAHAIAMVDRLVAARDEVAAAAGDDVALEAAMARLGACFEEITGVGGERRPGQTYAGRTLVYEDTVRDVRVALGPALREQLAGPLTLLLDSGRWLVAEIGQEYERYLTEVYERRVAQTGGPQVPLASILSLVTPQLYFNVRSLSKPVRRAVDEFQRRWADVLRLPPDARHVTLRSADIAGRVAELFPPRPLPWPTAVHHSPDFMLAAADEAAVDRGEFLLVLGELHLSFNTMESRVFVEQHDDPPSMLAAAEADLGRRRIYGITSRDVPGVSSRVAPPSALLSPGYTYWTMHPEAVTPPAPIIPAADLVVDREGERLVVRSRSGDFEAPLAHVVGEPLAAAAINAFKPVARGSHSPRITVDRLVVARESWTFPAGELAWAAVRSEPDRFLAARRWRLAHGLPERAFYKVPVEDKPAFVDFTSLVLVNTLAKAVRRSAEQENGAVTLTEMLPDADGLWLRDAEGARYTSEFRVLAVDLPARDL